jgi:hypothetical protein
MQLRLLDNMRILLVFCSTLVTWLNKILKYVSNRCHLGQKNYCSYFLLCWRKIQTWRFTALSSCWTSGRYKNKDCFRIQNVCALDKSESTKRNIGFECWEAASWYLLVFLVKWKFKTNLSLLFLKAVRYDKSTMRNIYMLGYTILLNNSCETIRTSL